MTEKNTYDTRDRVARDAAIIAGPLKLAAYRVRDPETDEWSKTQFHMTYDNTVLAMLSEDSMKLLLGFAMRHYPKLIPGVLVEDSDHSYREASVVSRKVVVNPKHKHALEFVGDEYQDLLEGDVVVDRLVIE